MRSRRSIRSARGDGDTDRGAPGEDWCLAQSLVLLVDPFRRNGHSRYLDSVWEGSIEGPASGSASRTSTRNPRSCGVNKTARRGIAGPLTRRGKCHGLCLLAHGQCTTEHAQARQQAERQQAECGQVLEDLEVCAGRLDDIGIAVGDLHDVDARIGCLQP